MGYLEKRRYFLWIIVFLLVVIIPFIVGGLIVFLSRLSFQRPESFTRNNLAHSKFNKNSGAPIILHTEQGVDGYISYKNIRGETVIRENFGNYDYKCTGSCFCDELDRRRSASVLSKGITVLLTAVSSMIATYIASNQISNHCEKKFLGVCSSDNIRGEIDKCESVVDLFPKEKTLDDEFENIEKEITKELEEKLEDNTENTGSEEFICTGSCVLNEPYLNTMKRAIFQQTKSFMNSEQMNYYYQMCKAISSSATVKAEYEKEAEMKFIKFTLSNHCRESIRSMTFQIQQHIQSGKIQTDFSFDQDRELLPSEIEFIDNMLPEDESLWLGCVGSNNGLENESVKCASIGRVSEGK